MRAFVFGVVLVACSGGDPAQREASGGSGGSAPVAGSSGASGGAEQASAGSGGSVVCEPGRSESCACTDGSVGAQVCASDALSWDPCECEPVGGSTGASGAAGAGGESSGGGGTALTGGAGGGQPIACPSKWATEGCPDESPPCEATWTQWTVLPGQCLVLSYFNQREKPGAYINLDANDGKCASVPVRAAAIKIQLGGDEMRVATAPEWQYLYPIIPYLAPADSLDCEGIPDGVTLVQ